MKSAKVTTSEQFNCLLYELRKRPEMATGAPVFGSNRQQWERTWEAIRSKLNCPGPPHRSTIEWKKVWADLKSRTKRKLAANAIERNKTGGGSPCLSSLTPTEQEVDKIISLTANVCPVGQFHGENVTNRELLSESVRDDEASTSAATASLEASKTPTSPVPERRKTEEEAYILLLREQNNFLGRIAASLEQIASNRSQ